MSPRRLVALLFAVGPASLLFAQACGTAESANPTSTATGSTAGAGGNGSASASVASGGGVGGTSGAGGSPDEPSEDEPDEPSSSSSGSMLDGTTPNPLPKDHPGGWAKSTLVFSNARMVLDKADNDRVELGFIELDSTKTATACSNDGPRARRVFYSWSDGTFEKGDCAKDKYTELGVEFRRWDHVGKDLVDQCPGKGHWVKDGQPTMAPFLFDCPAHATSGFGDAAARKEYVGHYIYDPDARTLVFRYEVAGQCRKEYFRDLTLDATGKLLGAVLDGAKTGDTSSVSRGLGHTHGYAFASPTTMSANVPFQDVTAKLRTNAFLTDSYRFREAKALDPSEPIQPEHHQKNGALGFKPEDCASSVGFSHSCVDAEPDEAPYLAACANQPKPKTAFLRFLVAPFGAMSPREYVYWGWHAHKAKSWSGCYHLGSHSNPALQVLDADGTFRGFVGIEMQSSSSTEKSGAGYVRAKDAYLQTDYRTWRWIESGFEPILAK